MFTLVIGGSGSGKSEFAERLVCALPGERIYIATMEPWDEECRRRIARHRDARAGRGFRTIECYTNLSGLRLPPDSNVLLECLGNLTANEMYSKDGGGAPAVLKGVLSLAGECADLTVVTNEVFSGGCAYEGDTISYLRAFAQINRELAARADSVIEVTAGCPNYLKGKAE